MVSTAIMKKHLLLLNRLHKQQLKKELIPTPTKLTKEEITKYFNSHFTKKENYYIPKLSTELKLNEEDFKKIAPKIYEKKKVEKKPVIELKKAEATLENLPKQKKMKAKEINQPKLEKVKAEKITLERPQMKKAEVKEIKKEPIKAELEKSPIEDTNNYLMYYNISQLIKVSKKYGYNFRIPDHKFSFVRLLTTFFRENGKMGEFEKDLLEEKKKVEKKPLEMKKAEATKEDLQQEMKAKKIKLPKLEMVKAEKITLEKPQMKKAKIIFTSKPIRIKKIKKGEEKEEEKKEEKETIKEEVKEPVKELTNKEKIVNEWDTVQLPTLFYQLEPTKYNEIEKYIENLNKKNKEISVDYFTSFFKDYNDEIIEKYGIKKYIDSLEYIAKSFGAEKVFNPFLKNEGIIKLGWFNQKNRKLFYKYTKDRRPVEEKYKEKYISTDINPRNKYSNEDKEHPYYFYSKLDEYNMDILLKVAKNLNWIKTKSKEHNHFNKSVLMNKLTKFFDTDEKMKKFLIEVEKEQKKYDLEKK